MDLLILTLEQSSGNNSSCLHACKKRNYAVLSVLNDIMILRHMFAGY